MARLSRDIIVTEKIDGTNASIFIQAESLEDGSWDDSHLDDIIATKDGLTMRAGSRTKWIRPGKTDNAGFAGWAKANADELFKLGEGHHFGEWWGSGIQRGYGLPKGEKRFSLFNTYRWSDPTVRPSITYVVPVLYQGAFHTDYIDGALSELMHHGSQAAPGFMRPEGIVVWHTAGNFGLKKTIEKDEVPKSLVTS